jgi:hypothetical protein
MLVASLILLYYLNKYPTNIDAFTIPPMFKRDRVNNNVLSHQVQKSTSEGEIKPIDDNTNIRAEQDIFKNDLLDDILYSEKEDDFQGMSETTNRLIDRSYNSILGKVYRKIILIIYLNHMSKDFEIKCDMDIYKDSIISDNFIELFRSYHGCRVYDYNKQFDILFTGDYLNNTGITNLNMNRTQLKIPEAEVASYIPARSISMVGVRRDNAIYIGSNFALNFNDIDDTSVLSNIILIPFGKFTVDDDKERVLTTYLLNTTDQINKPRIKAIYEANNGSLLG